MIYRDHYGDAANCYHVGIYIRVFYPPVIKSGNGNSPMLKVFMAKLSASGGFSDVMFNSG